MSGFALPAAFVATACGGPPTEKHVGDGGADHDGPVVDAPSYPDRLPSIADASAEGEGGSIFDAMADGTPTGDGGGPMCGTNPACSAGETCCYGLTPDMLFGPICVPDGTCCYPPAGCGTPGEVCCRRGFYFECSAAGSCPGNVVCRSDADCQAGEGCILQDMLSVPVPWGICGTAYTIGGTVKGLKSGALTLQDNGGDDLKVVGSKAFTFKSKLTPGQAYSVTVATHPSGLYCPVTSGTGTASADVTNVVVTCSKAKSYTIGGTLTGLAPGDSVVLQDNGKDDTTISANGGFTFATPLLQGDSYGVTVLTNPSTPPQFCTVSSGTGTVTTGPIANVAIACHTLTGTACGRFVDGYAGAWTTVSPPPFGGSWVGGLTALLPSGSGATQYVGQSTFFDRYDSATDTYTPLASLPVALEPYGSFAWSSGSVWTVTSGDVLQYDPSTDTWTILASGLTTLPGTSTTSDDAGNVWAFSSNSSLVEYDVTSGTTTYWTLPTSLTVASRITYDSCTGLLYLAGGNDTELYAFDPAAGTQTALPSLPAGALTPYDFQTGFCGDGSAHLFAITTAASAAYQYDLGTGVWTAMWSSGPYGNGYACGVGADGYLYATNSSSISYRVPLL